MASEVKANKLSPSSGTTVELGDSGDEIKLVTGVSLNVVDGVGVAGGGTGLVSFTQGDVLYATGSTTLAKLGKGTALQGLQTNSGATAPEWANSPQSLMTAAGDILYASGANTLAKLAKGSDDEVLTLASGVPSWASASGGAWTFIEGFTASTSALIAFTGFTSTYDCHKVFVTNATPSADTDQFYAQWRQSGSYLTSGYRYAAAKIVSTTTTVPAIVSSSASFMRLTNDGTGDKAGEIFNYEITIWDPLGTDNAKGINWDGYVVNQDDTCSMTLGAADHHNNEDAMDGIKFYMESGTIVTGTFAMYGLNKS